MIFMLAYVVAAFAVGAIPFGVLVSRLFFQRDLRTVGSRNIGAANALRTLGPLGAIAVLVLDGAKGALPVWLVFAALGRNETTIVLASTGALAAIVGHCFSPFLRGRGGKGVATHFGALLAFAWPAGAAFAVVWIAVGIAFGIASVASMAASLAAIYFLWFMLGAPSLIYGSAAAALIIYQHRANLGRLRAGTEPPLSLFRPSRKRTALPRELRP